MYGFGAGLLPKHKADQFVELTRKCEQWGYNAIWVPDERFYRDVYSELTLCSVNTERVFLGTCVTDPYTRHPAMTAAAIATIDEISRGRAVLGIGAGVSGFAEMGIQRKNTAIAVKEAVVVIKRLLAGERVDFKGETITLKGTKLDFPSRANIPIYVAGRGPKILEVAGEVADGVIIGAFASEPTLSYALNQVAKGAEKSGRDPGEVKVVGWMHLCMSEDEQAAAEVAKGICLGVLLASKPIKHLLGVRVPEELSRFLDGAEYGLSQDDLCEGAKLVPEEMIEHFTISGTPAKCAEKARAILELGVHHLAVLPRSVQGQSVEDSLRVFAENMIS